MSEPMFSESTELYYSRLPEHFRRMDALNNWALKKYISLCGEELQTIYDLIQRIDYDPVDSGGDPNDTSELANPLLADPEWLPWLGQLFGVHLNAGIESNRQYVVEGVSGFKAGTAEAIAAAAKPVLVGDKYAAVYRRSNSTAIGAGGPWDLLLVTRATETLINLIPEIAATIAETGSWTVTTSPSYSTSKKIVSVAASKNVYNNYAMQLGATNAAGTFTLTANSSTQAAVVATDWYQGMITLWSGSGSTYTGQITVRFYNASNSLLLATSSNISINGNPKQFEVGDTAPATATYMTVGFFIDDVAASDSIFAAQLGARHEDNTEWVAKTADPVAAVIERGAKPAGFKLWYASLIQDWNTVESNFPTWDDIEGESWTTVEESE